MSSTVATDAEAEAEHHSFGAAFDLEVGDDVHLETTSHEWTTPMAVVDVDEIQWAAALGDDWVTREVAFESSNGTEYRIELVEGLADAPSLLQDGRTSRGLLQTLELAEPESHPCPDCGKTFDDGRALSAHRNTPHTDCGGGGDDESGPDLDDAEWLARPPTEIVDQNEFRRDLGDVLDEVQRHDSVIDLHQRFGANKLSATKNILWELGLVQPNKVDLVDDELLQERVDVLRRWCE